MTYMVGVVVHGLSSKVPDTVGNPLPIPGCFPGTNVNTWNNEIHMDYAWTWQAQIKVAFYKGSFENNSNIHK